MLDSIWNFIAFSKFNCLKGSFYCFQMNYIITNFFNYIITNFFNYVITNFLNYVITNFLNYVIFSKERPLSITAFFKRINA